MPRLDYIAVSAKNERLRGSLVADNEDMAARMLAAKGLFVLRIAPPSFGSRFWELLNKDVTARTQLSDSEIMILARDWGNLIEAGIPLKDALIISEAGLKSKLLRQTVAAVIESVTEGASLHGALATLEGRLPNGTLALIKAGEEARTLGGALSKIARDLGDERVLKEELRNALLYPAFIGATATIAIIVLLTVVVPSIETLLGNVSAKNVPAVTSMVIGLSQFLRAHGFLIALILVPLMPAIFMMRRVARWRQLTDRWMLGLPALGGLLQLMDVARLFRALGELLHGGVSLAQALPLASATIRNVETKARLGKAQSELLQGASLTVALSKSGCLSDEAIQVVRVGERIGKLPELAAKAAVVYEQRSRSQLKALTTILGPSLTVVFGLLAGVIIYAVMTTILSLNELAFQ